MITGILLRLLIGVLVIFLGEKVIGLIKDPNVSQILNIVLLIAVVLYVIFGSVWPL